METAVERKSLVFVLLGEDEPYFEFISSLRNSRPEQYHMYRKDLYVNRDFFLELKKLWSYADVEGSTPENILVYILRRPVLTKQHIERLNRTYSKQVLKTAYEIAISLGMMHCIRNLQFVRKFKDYDLIGV